MRLFCHQPLHHEAPQSLRQPFSQPQVQLADRLRIGNRHLGERTTTEDEVNPAATHDLGRSKAPMHHLRLQYVDRLCGVCNLGGQLMPVLSTNLSRLLLAGYGLAQEPGQPGVGTGCFPAAGDFRIQAIEQPRPTRKVPLFELFCDKRAVFEHGQMLAHGVVVERNQLRELREPQPVRTTPAT